MADSDTSAIFQNEWLDLGDKVDANGNPVRESPRTRVTFVLDDDQQATFTAIPVTAAVIEPCDLETAKRRYQDQLEFECWHLADDVLLNLDHVRYVTFREA